MTVQRKILQVALYVSLGLLGGVRAEEQAMIDKRPIAEAWGKDASIDQCF